MSGRRQIDLCGKGKVFFVHICPFVHYLLIVGFCIINILVLTVLEFICSDDRAHVCVWLCLRKVGTLPERFRTVNRDSEFNSDFDIYKHNPWRSPGNAPTGDACGLAGGTPWPQEVSEVGSSQRCICLYMYMHMCMCVHMHVYV